ncbi:MAG: N-acetylmuramoyl-L-alanine amidase family protein [Ignavibacteriales bacterium]
MRIGIDPGHGGKDPGAIGHVKKIKEDDIALDIALALKIMETNKKRAVTMTRLTDVFIPLPKRSQIFDKAKVDFTVSIHINSSKDINPGYVSTWIYAAGGQAEKIAKTIQNRLVETTGWPDGGVRTKDLHMVREPDAPSILVEVGFISNTTEEAKLAERSFRVAVAKAISSGIDDYLKARGLK